jgi:pimeloyl-ACP methyl ester carboxylesterase
MPHLAYSERDWAEQLDYFLREIVRQPTLVLAQGAELAIALALVERQTEESNLLRGIVAAGPPPWALMTEGIPSWQQKLGWNLLDSPLGAAFYRYARRRQFLRSFSERQLFAEPANVDDEWLDMLVQGASNTANRYAVFSFLSGFWRRNYESIIAATPQPTLIVMGEQASSISRTGQSETPEERTIEYVKHLPQGQARQIPGRNVLPYESTREFVGVVAEFANQLQQ